MTKKTFWPFPKIANTAAREIRGDNWNSFADYYLEVLVGDFWRGDLPQVFYPYGGRDPEPITREQVWKYLGDTKPPAFCDVQEGETPVWGNLAKARSEDYGSGGLMPGLRNTILAKLRLREADAKSWISSQGKAKRPRGRPTVYDWDEFWGEVVRIANTPVRLPDKQADLEKQMLDWCDLNWGKQPAESTIRGKLARLYQNREAEK